MMAKLQRVPKTAEAAPLAEVAVVCESADPTIRTFSRRLAKDLSLNFLEPGAENAGEFDLLLTVGMDGFALKETQVRNSRPLRVDFTSPATRARSQGQSIRRQPLARAVGIRGAYRPSVIDATAGLGRDAFQLASLGCQVTAIERSPVLFALLSEGYSRSMEQGDRAVRNALTRLNLEFGNAYELMPLLALVAAPDVVYLDPMYPIRTKSALMKKEMRLCRRLVGDDPDAAKLFKIAVSVASRRVVVKRHRHAPPLAPNPTTTITATVIRYDVYVRANEPSVNAVPTPEEG